MLPKTITMLQKIETVTTTIKFFTNSNNKVKQSKSNSNVILNYSESMVEKQDTAFTR